MTKTKRFIYIILSLIFIIFSYTVFKLNLANYVEPIRVSVIILLSTIILLISIIPVKSKIFINILEFLNFICLIFVIGFTLITFVIFRGVVSGSSMLPTFKSDENVWVYKFNYQPKKNDVIVYNVDKNNSNDLVIKRIAALKGDQLSLYYENNKYYLMINDSIYYNIYGVKYQILETYKLFTLLKDEPYILKADEIIVLGDNEGLSEDSRQNGIYNTKYILGKVLGDYSGKE